MYLYFLLAVLTKLLPKSHLLPQPYLRRGQSSDLALQRFLTQVPEAFQKKNKLLDDDTEDERGTLAEYA